MTEEPLPMDDLKDFAEKVVNDKRGETGSEALTRELYDVPSASAEDLAVEQGDDPHSG